MKKLLILTCAAAMVAATGAFAEDGYLESEGDAFISLGTAPARTRRSRSIFR